MADVDWQNALAEHNRWLRTVIYARVGQATSVDEVMQEVALAVVRQQAPLADPEKLAPWLYRLAVRQSLMYRRKQGRRRKLVARYVDRVRPTMFDREPDPLEWLLADERQELVRRAMADMPRRDAEILMLKYSEQWTYQQLARHLGTSASAVESRLHRARQRLRRQLATFECVRIKP